MQLPLSIATICLAASCVSCPTPSGRPELRVSVEPTVAKNRLVNGLSTIGYMVTGSDDVGVSATRPFEPMQEALLGPGSFNVRFNLTPINHGTQIRGTVFAQRNDVSGARGGHDMQVFLENTFRDVMVDGPYVR